MATNRFELGERRSFFSKLAAGAAIAGGALFGSRRAEAQSVPTRPWQPARHAQDDWLDQIPGAHRFIIDTVSPDGLGNALLFANNFFIANQNGYGLGNADNAVVIVLRHNSTGFAYTDAIWGKYGTPIGDATSFDDPKTKARPSINVYNKSDYGGALPNFGVSLDALIGRGVHFAVCQMATRRIAGVIATARGANTDEIYKELTSNLIRNSHMAPAGIVAVNRAQERGYSLAVAS